MFAYGNMIRYDSTLVDLTSKFFVVSPAKHKRHIRIMTPAASPLSALSHFWLSIDNS